MRRTILLSLLMTAGLNAPPLHAGSESAAVLLGQARSAYESGDLIRAYRTVTTVLKAAPADLEARRLLDSILSRFREFSMLEKIFRDGMDQYRTGHYTAAIEQWERVRGLDPDYPQVIYYLDLAHQRLAEFTATQEVATRTRRLESLYEKASTFHRQGRWDEAVDRLTEIQRIQPGLRNAAALLRDAASRSYAFHAPLGLTLARRERFADALPHLERAAALARWRGDPPGGTPALARTLARAREAVSSQRNTRAAAEYEAGLAAYVRGDRQEAVARFLETTRLVPDHPHARRALERMGWRAAIPHGADTDRFGRTR